MTWLPNYLLTGSEMKLRANHHQPPFYKSLKCCCCCGLGGTSLEYRTTVAVMHVSRLYNSPATVEATHILFKEFKKELGLNNADIAQIVGLTPDSVKTTTQPNKELPSWAKAMIFTWQKILK